MHSKIELNVVIGNCYLQYTNKKITLHATKFINIYYIYNE
jgi:hypothetical protein